MKFKQRNGTNQTTQKTWQNAHTFHRQPLSTYTLTNGFPAIITQNISHRRLHKHSATMAFNYTCHVVGDFWRSAHWVVGTVPVVADQEGMQNKWHILWKDACKKGILASVSKEGSYLQWYTYFCSDEVNKSDESILGDLWTTITEFYQKSVMFMIPQ